MKSAFKAATTHEQDFVAPVRRRPRQRHRYGRDSRGGVKIGVDPLGGASLHYWQPIAERYGLDLQVVNKKIDPQFAFMTVDHDGKIRMDCSSPYAMASLVG
jgi:phosphoglucomutase